MEGRLSRLNMRLEKDEPLYVTLMYTLLPFLNPYIAKKDTSDGRARGCSRRGTLKRGT